MSKKVRNGFYFFMVDYKKKEEQLGRNFPEGFQQIQKDPQCSEEWAALSYEQKKEYNERAKRGKIMQQKSNKKLTTTGESIHSVQEQQLLKSKFEEDMKQKIDNKIEQADLLNAVDTISFYFIHANYFYTKTALDSTVDYIPAEFSVCEFSIKNGASRFYHQIIKTKIELGYAREAAEVSDSTHKLNYDLPEGEENYEIMCNKLINFLRRKIGSNDKLPPLYTIDHSKTIVPCLLRRMTAAADISENTFELYSLEYLFGSFMKYLNPDFPKNATPSVLAEVELTNGAITYAWSPKIECAYHSGIEGTKPYCSQAILHHWIFTFCDYCCPRLKIQMRPGIHCPESEKEQECSTLSDSLQYLSLKKRVSTFKSETGVSREHREKVSSRTAKEEEERRNKDTKLTIIDHSKLSDNKFTEEIYKPLKQMRRPRTMPKILDDQKPKFSDEDFPSLSTGRGTTNKFKNPENNSRPSTSYRS